jgi:hypothetical protein
MFRVLRPRSSPSRAAASPVVVRRRGRLTRCSLLALLGQALANPTLADMLHCTTYEEKTLQCWDTICDDGTRAVCRYNTVLDRWETTMTASLHPTCIGRMHPRTQQVEVRCRQR